MITYYFNFLKDWNLIENLVTHDTSGQMKVTLSPGLLSIECEASIIIQFLVATRNQYHSVDRTCKYVVFDVRHSRLNLNRPIILKLRHLILKPICTLHFTNSEHLNTSFHSVSTLKVLVLSCREKESIALE